MNNAEIAGTILALVIQGATYLGLSTNTNRKTRKRLAQVQFNYDFGKYGEAYRQAYLITKKGFHSVPSLSAPKELIKNAAALVSRIEEEFSPAIEEEICRAVRLPQEQIDLAINLASGSYFIHDPEETNFDPPFGGPLKLEEVSPTFRRYFQTTR